MNKSNKYLVFSGTIKTILKNHKLYTDHQFYSIEVKPKDKIRIVDDSFSDANVIPESIAKEYAKKYKNILTIVNEEFSDDEYIIGTVKELAEKYGIKHVRELVTNFFNPKNDSLEKNSNVCKKQTNKSKS